MAVNWYALRSKPNKEDFLFQQLEADGIEVYYPRLHVKPVNPRARKVRPYFPGYLFIRADLSQVNVSALKWTPGVSDLVSFDGEPASVPDHLIIVLRKQVEQLNAIEQATANNLKPGDLVIIHDGPFSGYEGIFDVHLDGQDRVRVLLDFLQSRKVPVDLKKRQVRRADHS